MIRINPEQEIFKPYQHFSIDVDDMDDENLLEHFPAAIRFIQSGLDAGGSVLVHWWVSLLCFRSYFLFTFMDPNSPPLRSKILTPTPSAMGKSRSATVCISYLLYQQPTSLTPQSALALIRQNRPLCEPNDGFMQQLDLYHEMGCPDEVVDNPLYQRWLYRREVEESVACGRAPERQAIRFEDEQPLRSQEDSGRSVEVKCRKCRYGVYLSALRIGRDDHDCLHLLGAHSPLRRLLSPMRRPDPRAPKLDRMQSAPTCFSIRSNGCSLACSLLQMERPLFMTESIPEMPLCQAG